MNLMMMMNLLRRNPTRMIERVANSFESMIVDLREAVTLHSEAIQENNQQILSLYEDNSKRFEEVEKAERLADNLESLLN